MKKLSLSLFAFTLVSFVGCTKSEPGGGQDRATKFTIEGPALATSIKQGESQTVHLKINRGKEFKETVKVKAEPPSGIEVAVFESTVKPSEKGDVNIKVVVAKDVAPGEHKIRVIGTPETGAPTSLDVKVKVAERSDNMKLTLKAPSGATSIKQGEAQTIKITFEEYDKYLADLKLNAEAPKGLTVELTPSTVRAADKGVANLRVTADKDAAIGEHTIHVTGKADAASVSPVDVKVKVVAP